MTMEKEKAAISIMNGLRQKFARERGKEITYSADELHLMFSESINKIKRDEDIVFDTTEDWEEINKQIARSNIKRYPWREIFGKPLTQMILTFKKHGFSAEETINEIHKDSIFKKFLEHHIGDQEKIIENVKISVHARYGENETAKKIMGDKNAQ